MPFIPWVEWARGYRRGGREEPAGASWEGGGVAVRRSCPGTSCQRYGYIIGWCELCERVEIILLCLFGWVSGRREFARWKRSVGWGETLAGCSTLDDTRLPFLDVFRGLTIAVRRVPHPSQGEERKERRGVTLLYSAGPHRGGGQRGSLSGAWLLSLGWGAHSGRPHRPLFTL